VLDRGTVEAFVWLPRFPAVSPARFFVARIPASALVFIKDVSPRELELYCLRRTGQAMNYYNGHAVRLAKRDVEGRWHHVACTWGTSEAERGLYLDGVRLAENGAAAEIYGSQDWESFTPFVGFEAGPNLGKVVRIDELRLSKGILVPAPETVRFGTRFEPTASTCGLWHFDEMPGATWFQDAAAAQVDRRLTPSPGTTISAEGPEAAPYGQCSR
jgi:hypothetical protein